MNLYLFNYTHDIALACGHIHYNPSNRFIAMERDLMPLAVFCSGENDFVAVENSRVESCFKFYADFPFVTPQFVSEISLPLISVQPWGWDFSLLHRLQYGMGKRFVMEKLVPSWKWLDDIRTLSSRRNSVKCLRQLRLSLKKLPLCGEQQFCTYDNQIEFVLKEYKYSAVFKAPLSSSGRGIRMVKGPFDVKNVGLCHHLLKTQGGVEIEPFYDKVDDWACEFYVASDGSVAFTGLSHFFTSDYFSYCGGYVASQRILREKIGKKISLQVLDEVIEKLREIIAETFSQHYEGPLGVDMMLCRVPGLQDLQLHPCVEINLRRTMGQLAIQFSSLLEEKCSALFHITYEKQNQDLYAKLSSLPVPRYNEVGLLVSGSRLLTPFCSDSHYAAWLEIKG